MAALSILSGEQNKGIGNIKGKAATPKERIKNTKLGLKTRDKKK